jgi:hypothetical protein
MATNFILVYQAEVSPKTLEEYYFLRLAYLSAYTALLVPASTRESINYRADGAIEFPSSLNSSAQLSSYQ